MRAPLRITQVAFVADAEHRAPRELLRAWPTLHAVARGIARAGGDLTVVQPAHASDAFDLDGVHYRFVAVTGDRWIRGRDLAQTVAAVAASAPDVVYMNGLNTPRAIPPLRRAVGRVPIVVQDRAGIPPRARRVAYRLAHRWANARLDGVIFTSAEQASPWHRSWALPRRVPVFRATPMSSDLCPGDQVAARAEMDMRGDPCLLSVARLDDNKDPLTMLRAVELAAASLPRLRLYCCFGDAPLLGAVKDYIVRSERLRERVVLLGARPHAELERRYQAADFLLQASHFEGCGYSVIEALSCGVTPLVTDIPSFRALVGTAGSLTPVEDHVAMARAIVDWSSRDRAECRRAARAQFDRALAFSVVGDRLLEICATVATNRRACAVS